MSWPVVRKRPSPPRRDPTLDQAPVPVAHLGYVLADGGTPASSTGTDQGCWDRLEGRTTDDAAYWLAQAAPAWRDQVRVVAIDMCSIYASALRRMLPGRADRRGLSFYTSTGRGGDRRRAPLRRARQSTGGGFGPATRLRGPDRRHERDPREPEQAHQARKPASLRLP